MGSCQSNTGANLKEVESFEQQNINNTVLDYNSKYKTDMYGSMLIEIND